MKIESLRLAVLPLALLALASCNTIAGLGEDVEAGGQAVEETAEDTESELEE